ncbi:MAG TPA: hypothetical protein VNA16_03165, partial [Abditibacteriaceae bacterium]|nr:hypothetical protein [Abditibacteriaceae bacterium]
RCRRTVAAVTWTMGTGLFALIFVPSLLLTNSRSNPGDFIFDFLRCWHPYIALATLFDRGYAASRTYIGLTTGFTLFMIGCCLLLSLSRAMRDGMRAPE